jgi:hypothetical protein
LDFAEEASTEKVPATKDIDYCSCGKALKCCCCKNFEYNLRANIVCNFITGIMGFEVEVLAGNSQRYYDISGDNLKTLERVFLSHCHAKSLTVTVSTIGTKSKHCNPVNLSSFRCLQSLEYMDIKMNNVATFTCDTPFLFQLKHLSLTRCQMTHYDFCILMNCVADTLESLELIQTNLMDVKCSENVTIMLNELHRLSNLKSLKLDKPWKELQKDHFIYSRLDSLAVSKISFEDLFSASLRKLSCTVISQILTVDGKDYKISDLETLQGIFHHFAAKSYSTIKFGDKRKKSLSKAATKEIDAKSGFRFVLGWPKIEPDESSSNDYLNFRMKEIFAFESLKVFIPRHTKKFGILDSPISLSPAMSPIASSSAEEEEEETTETFHTAFESLPEIYAAS